MPAGRRFPAPAQGEGKPHGGPPTLSVSAAFGNDRASFAAIPRPAGISAPPSCLQRPARLPNGVLYPRRIPLVHQPFSEPNPEPASPPSKRSGAQGIPAAAPTDALFAKTDGRELNAPIRESHTKSRHSKPPACRARPGSAKGIAFTCGGVGRQTRREPADSAQPRRARAQQRRSGRWCLPSSCLRRSPRSLWRPPHRPWS